MNKLKAFTFCFCGCDYWCKLEVNDTVAGDKWKYTHLVAALMRLHNARATNIW